MTALDSPTATLVAFVASALVAALCGAALRHLGYWRWRWHYRRTLRRTLRGWLD